MKEQIQTIEKPKRQLGTHALCAKEIRVDLKKAFPTIKFKVVSATFANGNSVDVDWDDGPSRTQVESIIKQYQYGHFDGMIDMYEYSNGREDIPQSKYVMADRSLTEETVRKFAEQYKKEWGCEFSTEDIHSSFEWHEQYTSWSQLAWKELCDVDLTNGIPLCEIHNKIINDDSGCTECDYERYVKNKETIKNVE